MGQLEAKAVLASESAAVELEVGTTVDTRDKWIAVFASSGYVMGTIRKYMNDSFRQDSSPPAGVLAKQVYSSGELNYTN
ncbi:hypothetical protein T265_11808 [Opisthorchis viverrini]|uniref:Uncharacterized protein n=1 Tax=Opisthorchis viverrini TaxID=6198 RepID=A0A074Z1Q0_OPIVI|nr:hypothetical protein T265_11808 [Opisthorchis viverrini]KER19417.1 hypothetical protein T265_11808 [Opisthorchis viverrini]